MRNIGVNLPASRELERDRPNGSVRYVFFFIASFVATFLAAMLILVWLL